MQDWQVENCAHDMHPVSLNDFEFATIVLRRDDASDSDRRSFQSKLFAIASNISCGIEFNEPSTIFMIKIDFYKSKRYVHKKN